MRKDGESRFLKKMIKGITVFAMVISMTGCQTKEYERIELTAGMENASGESWQPEIRISSGDEETRKDSGIMIEPEQEEASADGTESAETGENQDLEAGAATLLFGGDVLLSSHVLNAYQNAGGIHGVVDEAYRNIIRNADFFMVNEEFPFSSRGVQAEDKQYTFRLEPERVSMFLELGIDGVTLANNHALDFGVEALLDTCTTLDNAGILRTGAGTNLEEAKKPVEVELQGETIAIIGATRVIPEAGWAAGKNHPGMLASYDATTLLEEITAQKQGGKFVIVYVHWGVERDERPQEYQRTLAQQYINAGADLVIGSHPHVLQGIEYYKGKPIVYSLGNFVFGSSIPRTMLLEVSFLPVSEGDGSELKPKLRLIPGTSGAGYTRMLTDAGKLQEFRQYMESISFGITLQEDGTVISSAQ